jgi:hypothetical protein
MVSRDKSQAVQIGFRVSEELKQAAEKAATDDCRTLSSLVEKVLVEHLRKIGYWQQKGPGSA